MKIICISQARAGSSRLPKKIFIKVNGKSLLEIHLMRALQSKKISKLLLATTTNKEDDQTVFIADQMGVSCYRGSEDDVLDRYYQAAKKERCDYIVRITSDCPFIDANLIDLIIDRCIADNYDYASNTLHPTFPDGTDVEVFKFSALEKAWKESVLKSDREHVTPYIWRNSSVKGESMFRSFSVENTVDYSNIRITIDEHADLTLIENLSRELGIDKNWKEYAEFLLKHPEYRKLNSHINRNEGYLKSLKKDNV